MQCMCTVHNMYNSRAESAMTVHVHVETLALLLEFEVSDESHEVETVPHAVHHHSIPTNTVTPRHNLHVHVHVHVYNYVFVWAMGR